MLFPSWYCSRATVLVGHMHTVVHYQILSTQVWFAQGAMAKATGWGAPTLGSIPGCCTICRKKSPRRSHVPKHRSRDGPGRPEDPCVAQAGVSWVPFPVSGWGRGSGIFLACVRRPYMQYPGAACPRRSSVIDYTDDSKEIVSMVLTSS
jgi:hypothetical protein